MFRSTEADSREIEDTSCVEDAGAPSAAPDVLCTAPASKYTCGSEYPVTVETCPEVSCTTTVAPSPVEETVEPVSAVPPLVPCPSRTNILDWSTSASPVFTSGEKPSETAPAESIFAEYMPPATDSCRDFLTLAAPSESVTAPASRCRYGEAMASARASEAGVSSAEPAEPDTLSVPDTSVAGSYAPEALPRM